MEQLNWDATYAIVLELMREHPRIELDTISLKHLYQMVIALPGFSDDPALATEEILKEIYRIWYEESIHDNKRT
jgi:FeS assembly protein IscX